MRIQLVSDIHTEFMADGGRSFIDSLDVSGADIVVAAGDVSDSRGAKETLIALARHVAPKPLVFVCGNHEHYMGVRQHDDTFGGRLDGREARRSPMELDGRKETWALIRGAVDASPRPDGREATRTLICRAVDASPNLHWLNNGIFEWRAGDGRLVRFLGTTLWFRTPPRHLGQLTNDYTQIRGFADWLGKENKKSIEFLRREVREGDVVVTHYLPSNACVAPKYHGDALNAFFVCDLTDLIVERKPALWLFGHTHESVNVTVGDTRCVSNPFGYVRHELNRSFDPKLVLEV